MSDALQSINLDQLAKTALGGADSSWIKPTIDKLQKIEADKEAAAEPIRRQTAKDADTDKQIVDKSYAGIEPVDIPKWDAEKEAAKVRTDPLEAFGSAASIFAIAASAFTHTPITNALNGSAAAMQAIKNGDEEGYQRNYDAFKENVKIALDRHNAQHEDYQDAIEKMKTDMAQGAAMITAATAKYGDQATALMNEAGLYEKLGSLQQSRASAARDMLEALPKLEMDNLKVNSVFAMNSAQKALADAQQSGDPNKIVQAQVALQRVQQQISTLHNVENQYGTGTTALKTGVDQLTVDAINEKISTAEAAAKAAGKTLSAQDRLQIASDVQSQVKTGQSVTDDPQMLAYAAETYRKTGRMPPMGQGMAGAVARRAILKEAAKQAAEGGNDAGADLSMQADIKADTSSLQAITKVYDSASAFENTALQNMKIAEKYMDKGAGTAAGSVVNRWIQAGRVATGDPDVAAFNQAVTTVANEVAKINSGSTGSQGATVSAQAEAADSLNKAYTPDQIREIFSVMKLDMQNKKDEYDLQRSEIKKRISGAGKSESASTRPAVGTVIQKGGKSYRITGYDPNHPDDPEVEPVQ